MTTVTEISREKAGSGFALLFVFDDEKKESEQIYFSSDNREVMNLLFGSPNLRCPAISSIKNDLFLQLSEAIRNPNVVIEVGRSGKIILRSLEEKKTIWGKVIVNEK